MTQQLYNQSLYFFLGGGEVWTDDGNGTIKKTNQ